MQRQTKLGKVVLGAILALMTVIVAAPAMADTTSVSWDFSTGLQFVPETEFQIAELTVPDAAGAECTAEVEVINGESVHEGININVYLNGILLQSLLGVEDEAFKISSDSEGFTSSGSDELTVFLEGTNPRVARSSSAGSLTVTCTPPDDGGGEGCTPGYWKQAHHFDSWTGYSPTDDFETVFGVDASFDKDLLGALEQGGGGEKALGRHAVAALLNSASGGVSYDYSTAEVIALVQDAYASGDFEGAKNLLAAANESGCPLN